MHFPLASSSRLRDGLTLIVILTCACGGGSTSPTQLAYEWLPQDSATVFAAESLFLARNGKVLASCGSSPALNCPGGHAGSPVGLDLDVTGDSIVAVDSIQWDVSVTMGLRTTTDIPVTIALVGECGIKFDTGPGADSTIRIGYRVQFVRWADDTTLNRLTFSDAVVTGLTSEDVALTGGFACQAASVGLSFFLGTLTSALAGDRSPLCGAEGPTLFQSCPDPAAAERYSEGRIGRLTPAGVGPAAAITPIASPPVVPVPNEGPRRTLF